MRRAGAKGRLPLLAAMLALLGACAGAPGASSPTRPAPPAAVAPGCATAEAAIHFDFSGASPARCVIEGARAFTLVIGPEHGPPINPSPWYAFRYSASPGGTVTVRLAYLAAKHRYTPKLTRDGTVTELPASVATDGRSATITLPAGSGIVSAQPIVGAARYDELERRLTGDFGGRGVELGQSLDGRAITAVRFGDEAAPELIVILGRQHPPEVTGTYPLEPFVQELALALQRDRTFRARFQILAVPLLNPDGVERGHWRANRGGIDLNRDWGPFTQPETRAVRDWLFTHAAQTTPAAMIDFHSTYRNTIYVQGDEASDAHRRFLARWLAGKEGRFPGYPFTIEKRNANPGSGTAKNWFFECFAIPAYTYEVGDDADRAATESAARALARDFVDALPELRPEDSETEKPASRSCLG